MRTNEQVTGIPADMPTPVQLHDLMVAAREMNYAPQQTDFVVIAQTNLEPQVVGDFVDVYGNREPSAFDMIRGVRR